MTRGHRRLVKHSVSRRIALVAAPLATAAVVGAGVVLTGAPSDTLHLAQGSVANAGASIADRHESVSRDFDRMALAGATNLRQPVVKAHRWTTDDLAIRVGPSPKAKVLGDLPTGKRIPITGVRVGSYAEVVLDHRSRWVTASYLSQDKPVVQQGLDFSPCGPALPGIVPAMQRAYFAVCNAFPQVQTYGGLGNRPEHDTGHAVDAMVYGDRALGDRIAAFLQAHASELDLYDIIWYQHIWTPVRASEGWRLMPDRGGITANHMDHVHFAVN